MAKVFTVRLADQAFPAEAGDVLLDAALRSGVDMPHDCRAGRCGSCRATVKDGITLGGEADAAGGIHTCQARVFSDLEIQLDELPPVVSISGRVRSITQLGGDVVEVTLDLPRLPEMRPGQYCRFRFAGFPERPFSPTFALTNARPDGAVRLHVKKVRQGRVTSELGRAIRKGHRVTMAGPFGHAFLKPDRKGRLVLFASGTGFAPIWALTVAALRENPLRQIILVAGARNQQQLYMRPALELAGQFPNVRAFAHFGKLTDDDIHRMVPAVHADDTMYAAGGPGTVGAVEKFAKENHTVFYADPFETPATGTANWLESARSWLSLG